MTKKLPRTAIWLLGFLLFLSVFRDVLANGRPLYCRINGESYWPGLRTIFVSENTLFKAEALRKLQQKTNQFEVWKDSANFDYPPIYAFIPFSPGEHSTVQVCAFAKPGAIQTNVGRRFVHWFGTDAEGRDVAATVISGARIALLTGALAMTVALAIGLGLGMIAGFFGDERFRIQQGRIWMLLISLPVAWFCAFTVRAYQLSTASSGWEIFKSIVVFLSIAFVFVKSGALFRRFSAFKKTLQVPIDMLIMRVAEIFSAIPKLILVIVLAVALRGLSKESIWLMIALIGAFSWTGFAKLVRSGLLQVRSLDYVTAARGLGMSEWRVLLRHALPNTLRPIYIAFAFGTGGAVLLEAYLSFLGFGGTAFRGISWGSLFFNESSTANPLDTWWVTLFPGLMIFITVLSLNRVGEGLSERGG